MEYVEVLRDRVTAQEVKEKVEELRGYVMKYGWEKYNVHPYNRPVNILEFLDWDEFRNYQAYTTSSKHIALLEINGLIKIVNKWLEVENEPKVRIRILEGKKKGLIEEVPASTADMFVEADWAEIL